MTDSDLKLALMEVLEKRKKRLNEWEFSEWRSATRRICSKGYAQRRILDHPEADSPGYVYEHRLVVEEAIGKPIPKDSVVHHVNHVKDDNRKSNLILCENNAYHRMIHLRQRALDACGNPLARKCFVCQVWEHDHSKLIAAGRAKWHPGCRSAYQREWARLKRDSAR